MTQDTPEAHANIDLAQLNAQFHAARGDIRDADWARTVQGRLMLDGVEFSTAREALTELLPVLEDADEPAEELFGDPVSWAQEQQVRWHHSGIQAYSRPELLSTGQFLQFTFFGAFWVSIAATIATLLSDGWTTDLRWTMLALPLFITSAGAGVQQVWTLAKRKHPRVIALVGTAAFVIAVSLVGGSLAAAIQGSVGTVSTLWLLAPAPVYALLCYASHGALQHKRKRPHRNPQDAEAQVEGEWILQLKEQLRLREDLSDRQVRVIVDETRAYAVEADASLDEEFGTPEQYAATFDPRATFRARRAAWGWTGSSLLVSALVTISLVNAGSPPTWQTTILAALLVGTLYYMVQSWRLAFKKQ